MRATKGFCRGLRAAPVFVALLLSAPADALAVLSESEGTGVWEVQTAESQRAATLQLGLYGSAQRLPLLDPNSTRLNALQGGIHGTFGIPGGFETSATLPVHGYYTTAGDLGNPFDQDIKVRLGDLTGRLRWTAPMGIAGLRWGLEGGVRLPTGSEREVVYPGRTAARPYTGSENSYIGRALLTWDGIRARSGIPLRLHVNAGYTIQRDESRFLAPRAPLPLELPTPANARANDLLTLAGAVEVDFPRLTLFGEIVTDQFTNERGLIRGKENRLAFTPGVRFWLPGGITIAGGYTANLAEDDDSTTFDPGRAWPDHEWRVSISLGTVYRGARARMAPRPVALPPRAVARSTEPEAPATVGVPEALAAVGVPEAPAAAPDSAAIAKQEREQKILDRREVQETPKEQLRPVTARGEGVAAVEADTLGAEAGLEPAPMHVAPPTTQAAPPAAPARPGVPYADTDRDGIADARDECPLLAEDWDGFQDLDGCPDVDNDRDGILDVRDECPNDPETYNGYYDFDGCPDEIPIRWKGEARTDAAPDVSPPPAGRLSADTLHAAPTSAARAPSATAAPRAAGPAATGAARPPAPESDLEERIARLEMESRQRAAMGSRGPDVLVTPQPATTVVAPPAASVDAATAARLAALESEVRALRDRPAAEPQPGAPRDSIDKAMLHRLETLQAAVADLAQQASAPRGTAAVEAPTPPEQAPSPEDPAAALDALLPVGTARSFPEVRFQPASATLEPGAADALLGVAQALRSVPEARVTVVGHTDDRGRASTNLRLSRDRARAVAAALFANGVARGQVTVEGRGDTAPVAPNDTEEGRSANRRVELVRTR